MARLSDQEIGAALANEVKKSGARHPSQLQGLVQDLLADDLEMRAPIREIIQSPTFLRATPLAGGAVSIATCDALISELRPIFQEAMINRSKGFLQGYLGIAIAPSNISQSSSTRNASFSPSIEQRSTPNIQVALDPIEASQPLSLLTPQSLKRVSQRMQKRLRRLETLELQGYIIKKSRGAFPFVISPSGKTILPSFAGASNFAGFSWIGFFFPFVACFQSREWSYFWVCGCFGLLASLGSLMMPAGGYGLLDFTVDLSIAIYYGISLPYLRYTSCRANKGFSPLLASIIGGILLSIISEAPSLIIVALAGKL